ncbi:MAG: glycine cleavage system protein H [Niastella sp. SCN 39-18]|nr:glycine cleavage system protein GcvH [Sphingobacteriales bacterium]ODT52296.1 MAG: glycine cleavage system protein H [Niastella sp. SCN 39-18]OJW10428.1 MAG: glycine cleavage system protein H [Sphingobacteriales bacterium 39-19]
MQFPADYKYSKEHTWLKVLDNSEALVGITEFAQSELGEIVYIDLPNIGKQFSKDAVFGSVEAVKTTSDLFMPVSGEILEVNTSLKDHADLVNTASFTDGWMIKIKQLNASEATTLMDAKAYESLVS